VNVVSNHLNFGSVIIVVGLCHQVKHFKNIVLTLVEALEFFSVVGLRPLWDQG